MKNGKSSILGLILAGIILFFGTGLAITYFHTDVNMADVQASIYKFITGSDAKNPWMVALPYSIGIGAGVLFYCFPPGNGKKPTPIELEFFNHEDQVTKYQNAQKENNSK